MDRDFAPRLWLAASHRHARRLLAAMSGWLIVPSGCAMLTLSAGAARPGGEPPATEAPPPPPVVVVASEIASTAAPQPTPAEASVAWVDMLGGPLEQRWQATNFGGEGPVELRDGVLTLSPGDPLTGVTWQGEFPTDQYEIQFEAQRVEGSDFFVGLTFPIGSQYCSFICGGWGGGLIGISSINGNDASENATASFRSLKNQHWYKFRIRVEPEQLSVWMDDEQIVDESRSNKDFSIRAEMRPCRPVGYSTFLTKAAVRGLAYRELAATPPAPQAAADTSSPEQP
jgi:hypothetical protein